ncbi:MAG: hypothetical protein ACI9WU_002014 [Myxococcota bacterium]
MADTKKITDRNMRKGIKRSQRRNLLKVAEQLTPRDRRQLRKEPQGTRAYLAAKAAEAAPAAE